MNDLEYIGKCLNPKCRYEIKIKVKEMYRGNKKTCRDCGIELSFNGDDGRKTQKAYEKVITTYQDEKTSKSRSL